MSSPGRRRALEGARSLLATGHHAAAERLLLDALAARRRDTGLLRALAALYVESARLPQAAQVFERLIELEPRAVHHYLALAAARQQSGDTAAVIEVYRRMTATLPHNALAHYNLACALRARGENAAALASHQQALALGIDQPEEAWSNIGAILADLLRHDEAREALERSLEINPRWIPGLYNLALWHEEYGAREQAETLFERVLALDPDYHDALARLSGLRRIADAGDPLLERLRQALGRPIPQLHTRESLEFALGKALDDCGLYAEAFAHYRAGNQLSRARLAPYDRGAVSRLFAAIRRCFDGCWLQDCPSVSAQPLVFIVGMFRSGTTLLEQMLAMHPALASGGEIDYWNAALLGDASGYPARVAADRELQAHLAAGYLGRLQRDFAPGRRVCDKRPDNYLYLGLLAGLFPQARFLCTRRDPRDTCLSIYFQQFEEGLGYTADPGDIAHQLREHQQLMRHWRALFPERLLDIDYEELVSSPEPVLRRACVFLDIDWHASMLRFHEAPHRVRTASVWQVREPLYARSIGRWRHYETALGAALSLEGQDDEASSG
jgi:tetratricopeptide (TPR) repeat protein